MPCNSLGNKGIGKSSTQPGGVLHGATRGERNCSTAGVMGESPRATKSRVPDARVRFVICRPRAQHPAGGSPGADTAAVPGA